MGCHVEGNHCFVLEQRVVWLGMIGVSVIVVVYTAAVDFVAAMEHRTAVDVQHVLSCDDW